MSLTPACSDDSSGGSPSGGAGGAAAGGSGTGGATAGGGPSAGGSTGAGGGSSGGAASGGNPGAGGDSAGGAAPDGGPEGGVPEGGDSGCTDGGGSCAPTAFRMTELVLLDPTPQLESEDACTSVLDAINGLIATNFGGDAVVGDSGAGDGELDLSFVMVHRPLVQEGAGRATFYQAACTAPAAGTTCSPKASLPGLQYTVSNQSSGTCLAAGQGNVTPGSGPVLPTTAGADGCVVSSDATFFLSLGPVNLTFDSARVAAQWVGSPATGMIDGLFIGFLSQERVNAITLPPELGSFALATAFPTGATAVHCTDEIDVGPDGSTPGWWWHLRFRAEAVGWTE